MKPPPRRIPPLGPPKPSARQRVLAQWRGVDLAPDERSRQRREKTSDTVVSSVLKSLRMDNRRAEAEIARVWNDIIDPAIAVHAQPVGIAKGTVFVDVDSSVWLDEIVRWHRKDILRRLQASFGREMIARISFRTK